MVEFERWILENVVGTDEVQSQIDYMYDKAKYAIKIVQMYSKAMNKRLLHGVSTIAPLNSGVYGLYNSSENRKVLAPLAANRIKFQFGQNMLQNQNLQRLPQAVIKQYVPDLDESQIAPSDVIHVNVNKIVRELGDTKQAVLEIASTIVHEATHEIEFNSAGKTDEVGPKKAEEEFKGWAEANWASIVARMPQLRFQSLSTT